VPTVENLLSKVYHEPKGEWTELGREFADSGELWRRPMNCAEA